MAIINDDNDSDIDNDGYNENIGDNESKFTKLNYLPSATPSTLQRDPYHNLITDNHSHNHINSSSHSNRNCNNSTHSVLIITSSGHDESIPLHLYFLSILYILKSLRFDSKEALFILSERSSEIYNSSYIKG